jgi:uncharacterized protein (DUF2126 family)/transglutaminase-like putative cysteine protease
MAIRVALHHKTEYLYDRPVTLLPQIVRLRPAPHCRTPVVSYSLKIEPKDQFLNWQQDPYSNYLARLVFPKPAKKLKVEVDLVVDMQPINPFDFFIEEAATEYPFKYEGQLAKELLPFLEWTENSPALLELVESVRKTKVRTLDYLVEINQVLQKKIGYVIRLEPGIQSCEETISKARGSCRDSAWLFVQVLRHLGLAARFVSGYLIQLTADVPALDGPSGPERDFTDLHAWTEVYIPGAGWIGFDPTSGLLAGEGHIPLACTADPSDAAPITGSFTYTKNGHDETDDVGVDFNFAMSIERIHEDPRVTKPYTPEQWTDILRIGYEIDRDLAAHDVRLTMGGEPTFVSIDDKDGAEWNTDAMGPTKRRYGDTLLRRLHGRFAPDGLLFHGQGKWYPGESLPRWAFAIYWRKDGEPIWTHPELFAREDRHYAYTAEQAQAFVLELANKLNVDPEHAQPGYEDAWYYMWKERTLPVNVDPLDSKIENKEDRERIAKVFDQGLKKVIGYALPVRRVWLDGQLRWQSGHWFLRRDHLFLIPGDSPMGFRLPLESLPWVGSDVRQKIQEEDPWNPRGPLPERAEMNGRGLRRQTQHLPPDPPVRASHDDPWVRTALCVEPREGRLHVFLPPVSTTEDFLDLISAIEATAVELNLPVQIEGYPPPYDPRMLHIKVTPDPGVIEVNVHPASDWHELTHITTALYEEARLSRLCTEKFQLDGKHTGTLGGNHMVLGGATPADSPFLRRPDLLRSLIAYWHNHPSLSYLFSGLFLGPTSQAPRIDEARNDAVYEMEIAFKQLPQPGGYIPPWLVDRIFRHLLVDVTGNTHRAEFCIDKLYSPDSPSGRHGLVEFRGFEMPPHSQMSLVQQLFLRTLIARFWNHPYKAGLVRWGTELHDKFMLPHFIKQDFHDVITELKQEGYPLDERWFEPHYEFRFPYMGSLSKLGLHFELRQAIEPWHVLGEEATGLGTARYVDSSLERVQVKLQGMVNGRHILTVNGRRVPLYPTGTNGEAVAGVRYRAWQPPSCLHPTIGIHSPLVFDLYDTWLNRAIAGCTYHVVHPGGRSYDIFPVNANEAEGRRINRFFLHGHTPSRYLIPGEERSPETPLTLDLRMPAIAPAVPIEPRPMRGSPHAHSNGKGAVALECVAPS